MYVCNNSEYKHNKFCFQSLLPLLKREIPEISTKLYPRHNPTI